jgi:CheY-like chemotaxis protein
LNDSQSGMRHIVLVVEDEPILRMTAVDMIEDAGFEAIEATDATQAVEILESRLDIRIVFTDIDMPRGMDGVKLAILIRNRWPPIDIIITSGHTDAPDIELPARSLFFAKPYDEKQILSAIRRFAS